MRQMAVVLGTEGRRRSAPAAVPEAGPRLPPVPMRLEPARNRGEGMSGWCIQSAYVAFAGKRGNLEALLGHPGMANMAIQEWPDLSEVVARAGSILDRFPECRVSLACRFLEDLFRQGRSRVTTSQMAALAERRNWLEIQFPRMARARKPGMYWGAFRTSSRTGNGPDSSPVRRGCGRSACAPWGITCPGGFLERARSA